MPFARNSLYGWGVCRISMPRASRDIFGETRAGAPSLPAAFQSREEFLQPFSALWTGLIKRDLPARTSLVVSSTALAAIILFSLSSLLIPRFVEETLPESVEIAARLMEEPLRVPTAVPRPRLAENKPALKPRPMPALPKREIVAVPLQDKPLSVPTSRKVVVDRTREIELSAPEEVPRNFDLTSERFEALPETGSRSKNFNDTPPAENLASAATVTRSYRIKKGNGAGGILPQGRVFVSAAAGTMVDLPSVQGIKYDFGRSYSQGDGGAPLSGRSFSPDVPSGEAAIGSSRQVARTYQVSGSSSGGISSLPGSTGEFAVGSGRSNEQEVDIPIAGGSGSRNAFANFQTRQTSAAPESGNVSFVAGMDAGPLDPALWVSLNQLGACVDQSEEDRLRTRLATMLETEGRCRTGNMIFIFKYPQDGWTMQVSLYNPIDFADKCSALLAAIECIHNSKQ
jgi:hypothetical protein